MKKLELNIDPELLEQIKVGALVVCAASLFVITYQKYRWLPDLFGFICNAKR
ncbi:hypothetical protein ACIP97_24000 [Peribacillus frigoritolerans]|uniref:hypothetical protein n=1 Tax=Peribacillus frigoritolerans TaxID=450367 RepID=UPI0037FCE39F